MKQILIAIAFVLAAVSVSFAHCQVPCGIYDDETRLEIIEENTVTIAKAMKMITDLSSDGQPNYNQIVRWINVKDEHADDIAHIVSWYFLQQRVKPVDDANADAYAKYLRQVTLLHEMLVYSMKAKQTTDLANVENLEALLDDFSNAYLGE